MARALAVLVVLLLAALGWQWGVAQHAGHRADVAQAALMAERTARQQEAAARLTETKHAQRLQENLDAEHIARLAVEADARRADAAAGSLRERARQLAAASRCPATDSAAAAGGPAAAAPGDLLADLLERVDEAAGQVGRYADQARLAGATCERAYRALTDQGD